MPEQNAITENSPIGVFDSGVGGLSILQAIAEQLPNERLIYLADTAFAPYGDRSDEQIIERAFAITAWMVEQGCKAVVVACNTATAAAIQALREHFSLPLIGVEPGLKPAIAHSPTGRVGVIATSYTVRSEKFRRLVQTLAQDVVLTVQACPGLVETLEQPQEHEAKLDTLLATYLEPMKRNAVDTLVLGCTHYIFLRERISDYLGQNVEILDTASAIAREVERQLIRTGQAVAKPTAGRTFNNPKLRYLTTGSDREQIESVMSTLLGTEIQLERVELD